MGMISRTDDEVRDHLIMNSLRTLPGCWEWLRAKYGNGYGAISYQGKQRLVHRVAYELFVGPIPEGLDLDHLCRNRACINPAHLEPVTRLENLRRGETIIGHADRRGTCKEGHPYVLDKRGYNRCPTCHSNREKEARKKPERRVTMRAYRERNRERINEQWRIRYHEKKGQRDATS